MNKMWRKKEKKKKKTKQNKTMFRNEKKPIKKPSIGKPKGFIYILIWKLAFFFFTKKSEKCEKCEKWKIFIHCTTSLTSSRTQVFQSQLLIRLVGKKSSKERFVWR